MFVLLTTGNIHLELFENFWSMAHWAYQNTQNPENDHFLTYFGIKKTTTSNENFLMKYIRKSLVFGPRIHLKNKIWGLFLTRLPL